MLESTGRKNLFGVETLVAGDRPESSANKRRSAARGILIGLGLAAILWLIIAAVVISLVQD